MYLVVCALGPVIIIIIIIAQMQYKSRHDGVARLIHHEIAKLVGDKWWLHKPPPVLKNSSMKILWDFTTSICSITDQILCFIITKTTVFQIDDAVPG